MLYRFPSWYRQKSVQSAEKIGTHSGAEAVQRAADSVQESPQHAAQQDTVPVFSGPCTGNLAEPGHKNELQPFMNQCPEPTVPEVPVFESTVSLEERNSAGEKDAHQKQNLENLRRNHFTPIRSTSL
jgi:hypothetical protein